MNEPTMSPTPSDSRISVVVLYNHVGEDEYEKLKTVDPATLPFKPAYSIHVSTVEEEYMAIVKGLDREGFRVRAVNIREDLRRLERVLKRQPPDVIFNLIEYFLDRPNLEGSVAGLFELYGIPYTGAPPFALSLCQRKGLTKQILLANGVPTPKFRIFRRPTIPRRLGLHYPVIVKPAREDASSGVTKDSVVYDAASLQERVQKTIEEFHQPAMAEEFIEGRELHVGILGNDPPLVLPIVEYDFSELPADHPTIISFAAKWDPLDEAFHQVHSFCPARLTKRVLATVEDTALRAYRLTGCRDYARLDIRLDAKNHVYVLEVNPNPDLTEGVSYMDSAEKAGLGFSETLRRIVEFAYARRRIPASTPQSQ
jgi:D-alanine-D-alanine ligase